MIIYPALDLRNGNCVRLKQGDYQQETVYDKNPSKVLDNFKNAGAQWCHIVDLNGAKSAEENQFRCISDLIQSTDLNIQTGGGIRTFQQAVNLFEVGVKRIIIGSLAISNPEETSRWLNYFGKERIVLALDVRLNQNQTPMVALNGWQQNSTKSIDEIISYYQGRLQHLLCTDIAQDGMLQGPNFTLYTNLIEKYPNLQIQASGGIQSLTDLKQLKQLGLAGCIVGRAFYENQISLSEALLC